MIILPRIAIKMRDGYEIEDVLTKFSQDITLDKKKENLFHDSNILSVLEKNK